MRGRQWAVLALLAKPLALLGRELAPAFEVLKNSLPLGSGKRQEAAVSLFQDLPSLGRERLPPLVVFEQLSAPILRDLSPLAEVLADLLPLFRRELAEAAEVLAESGALLLRHRLPEAIILKHALPLLG